MNFPHHRTKIVCTLGPATDRPGVLRRMLLEGMDVARINAVHGTPEVHRQRIQTARQTAKQCGVPLAILMDLPGPKHRLARLPSTSLELKRGQEIFLGSESTEDTLPLADPTLLRDLKVKDPIYLADGTVRLSVIRHFRSRVQCRVETGGTIRSGSGMNMPSSRLTVQLPTPQDRRWIQFACREGIDWIGISFVRTPQDVRNVRKCLSRQSPPPYLMAKIEKREALENLSKIAEEADGLMVARGDLGVETPLESVPLAQKRIILEGLRQAKPVITATQMLESMVEQPTPTRAEVTDVATAVLDGTDAVMLSAETAIGAYPAEAVSILNRVVREAETSYPYETVWARFSKDSWKNFDDSIGLAACRLSHDHQAQAILVDPAAKVSASRLARFRPRSTIFTMAKLSDRINAQNLLWSVRPIVIPFRDASVDALLNLLLRRRLIRRSSPVVVIKSPENSTRQASDLIQVVRV